MPTSLVDLHFQGHARVIATAVLPVSDGIALIDPGPTTCVPSLERGLRALGYALNHVRHILLTHIHLDHAGATGTLARLAPEARVWVHERGAPHMVDPTKLLASATRLYGDQMDTLWGAFEAVPPDRVTALAGGERLDLGGCELSVAYTPGHAIHHVSYFDAAEGQAYIGDTGGICVAGRHSVAATPPPDIDIESWLVSLQTIRQWRPATVFLTHFGPLSDGDGYLRAFEDVLLRTSEEVRRSLLEGTSDEARAEAFAERRREEARQALGGEGAAALELAAPFTPIWAGLARYWRRKPA
ncbi:MAG: MBL fold metallo-hydrolase [Acidobacteria bacterium]|nr:MBL fold metallo-hydrolase [Acidobacteriota bacterium]